MINRVEVKNFQALKNVAVDFGRLTVIVGQSSSGKSAFVRALSMLVSNKRGSSFITHGENVSSVTASTPRGAVSLVRGTKTADNYYTLEEVGKEQQEWTKLNGATPEEISEFLGIPSDKPLNFANQFDMPYLLKSTPGEVAQTLGELTNVHVIFNAARKAKNLAAQATSTLRTRRADLDAIKARAEEFAALKKQRAAVEQAEALYVESQKVLERASRLMDLEHSITEQQEIVERYSGTLAVELPDIKQLQQKAKELRDLSSLAESITQQAQKLKQAKQALATAAAEELELSREYLDKLKEYKECPTCHQSTATLSGTS